MATVTQGDVRISFSGLTILIQPAEEGETGYWGEVLELPGCVSQGETVDDLKRNMQEAVEAVLQHSMTSTPDSPSSFTTWTTTQTSTA